VLAIPKATTLKPIVPELHSTIPELHKVPIVKKQADSHLVPLLQSTQPPPSQQPVDPSLQTTTGPPQTTPLAVPPFTAPAPLQTTTAPQFAAIDEPPLAITPQQPLPLASFPPIHHQNTTPQAADSEIGVDVTANNYCNDAAKNNDGFDLFF
jgi:hypothetical protein